MTSTQLLPAAVAPKTEQPPAAQGVRDWSGALEKVGGDRELLHELIRVFLDAWPKWKAALGHALAGGDSAQVRRLAHTVKGALGQFEAHEAAEAAQRLESLGRDADLRGADEVYAVLEKEIDRLLPTFTALARESVPV